MTDLPRFKAAVMNSSAGKLYWFERKKIKEMIFQVVRMITREEAGPYFSAGEEKAVQLHR